MYDIVSIELRLTVLEHAVSSLTTAVVWLAIVVVADILIRVVRSAVRANKKPDAHMKETAGQWIYDLSQ